MGRHSLAEVITGALVLVVAVIFLAFAVAHSGRTVGSGYTLKANFAHIDGLAVGGDVRIAGVKVGSVTSAGIDPKTYQAVLGLTVRPDIQLPTDSSATIASGGLLGGGFVSLSPGGADTVLKDGGAITITQSAVNLEDLLGKFIFNVGSLADASQKMLQRQGGAPGGGQSGASP